MGTEVSSDVTSSGPVKLADLQRILSNIGPAGATQFNSVLSLRKSFLLILLLCNAWASDKLLFTVTGL